MSTLHHLAPRNLDLFAPTCPTGASWYACAPETGSSFVGCCGNDPCASKNGCSQGNIQPVSYNATSHGTPDFPPDVTCPAGSNFYSCASGTEGDLKQPTFWGCCKIDVCDTVDKVCPRSALVPAYLGSPTQVQAYTGEQANSSPSPSSSSSPSASSPPADSKHKTTNTAVIVGGAVGGAIVIVLIVCILIFCLKRRRARSRPSTPVDGASRLGEEGVAYKGHLHGNDEAPPTYSSPSPNHYPPVFGAGAKYSQIDQEPQEMPAELPLSGHAAQRYSEFPAEESTARIAEMESPDTSPQVQQERFGAIGSLNAR